MASDKIRKFLRKFIKANPLCSEEDLVAAAKRGDWLEVENQIRNFSNGGDQPPNIKTSLQARREIEANLFGGSLQQ